MALLLLRNKADCLVPNMETESVSSHLPPELNRSPTTAPAVSSTGGEADGRESCLYGPNGSISDIEASGFVETHLGTQVRYHRIADQEADLARFIVPEAYTGPGCVVASRRGRENWAPWRLRSPC